jgi:glutathione peroxidase
MKVLAILAAAAFAMLSTPANMDESPLQGMVKDIDGKEVDLAQYQGKVVMVVNVASKCGFTKHYEPLQAIYSKYKDKGLVVLGFPCNQFGGQEPGTEAEIKAFCEDTYSVSFPMFSKIDVNGDSASPLYKYLTSEKLPLEDQGAIKWNFEKFLFGKDGKIIARYRTRTSPDAPEVIEAIEAALAE